MFISIDIDFALSYFQFISVSFTAGKFDQSHRSYSDGDADLVPGAKSSNPMTINIKYVMILQF